MGFLHGKITYHDAMPSRAKQRLQVIDTLPALAIRNYADLALVHAEHDIAFMVEIKSRVVRPKTFDDGSLGWSGYDAFFEASQFVQMSNQSSVGAEVLYCFRNEQLELDVGFWSSDFPISEVKMIHWPERWRGDNAMRALLKKNFPRARHLDVCADPFISSGDPYAVIPYHFLERCRPWKELLQSKVDGCRVTELTQQTREQSNEDWIAAFNNA